MKDFSNAPKTSAILDEIETGSGANRNAIGKRKQDIADEAEQTIRGNRMQTQGRRGCKLNRCNIGLTPNNDEFISIVARVRGESKSRCINNIINMYRADHPDLLNKAKAFIEELL